MKRIAQVVALIVMSHVTASAQLPSDAEIKRILVDRIDSQKQGVGIVAGAIDANGRRVVAHGTFDTAAGSRVVDGDTVFEIGSAAKKFTPPLPPPPRERRESG